jgi:hypothetical protein
MVLMAMIMQVCVAVVQQPNDVSPTAGPACATSICTPSIHCQQLACKHASSRHVPVAVLTPYPQRFTRVALLAIPKLQIYGLWYIGYSMH